MKDIVLAALVVFALALAFGLMVADLLFPRRSPWNDRAGEHAGAVIFCETCGYWHAPRGVPTCKNPSWRDS